METLSTIVEFVTSETDATGASATADPFFTICAVLVAFAAIALTLLCICRYNKASMAHAIATNTRPSISAQNIQQNKSLGYVSVIIGFIIIATSLTICGHNGALAEEGELTDGDNIAAISQKVVANVDGTGTVSFESGIIKNNDKKLSIGVRHVNTETSEDLGNATLVIVCDDQEIYNKKLNEYQLNDEYAAVPVGKSSKLTYTIQLSPDKAKQLVGKQPITITTTADLVVSKPGTILDALGNPVANAKVTYSYTDPYDSTKILTGEVYTDENGKYVIPNIKKGETVDVVITYEDESGRYYEIKDQIKFDSEEEMKPSTPKTEPQVDDFVFVAPGEPGKPIVFDGKDKEAGFDESETCPPGMGKVTVEYRAEGSEEWTTTPPKDAGTYYTRARIGEGEGCTEKILEDSSWKFTIDKAQMSTTKVDSVDSVVYNGSPYTPEPTVSLGDLILLKDKDFSYSYENNIDAGTATITMTGKDANFTGSTTTNFTIKPKEITESMIDSIANQIYSGHQLKPKPTVTDSGRPEGQETLVEGTDFTYSYGDNVNVGTEVGTVTISGITNYTGSPQVKFTIDPKTITTEMIASIANQIYSGHQLKPKPTVTDSGRPEGQETLVEGTDFTYSYGDNVNVGTEVGTVTISGITNYTGSPQVKFTIDPKTITTEMIASIANQIYSGHQLKPKPTVTDSGRPEGQETLKEGTDFTYSYGDNVNVGTEVGTVTISGITNYTGSPQVKFTIDPKTITTEMIASIANQTYSGHQLKPKPTVTDSGRPEGQETLVEGTDFTYSYGDNVNVGTEVGTVTISGITNYTGTPQVKFTIDPKTITTEMIASIANQTYSGHQLKPKPTVTDSGRPEGQETLAEGTDFTYFYGDNVDAGKGSVTINGEGNYTGNPTIEFTINKAMNPIELGSTSDKTTTYNPSNAIIYDITKATKAIGTVTYSMDKVNGFSIDGATGKLTCAKATAANVTGYTIKVTATASGNNNYLSGSASSSFTWIINQADNNMKFNLTTTSATSTYSANSNATQAIQAATDAPTSTGDTVKYKVTNKTGKGTFSVSVDSSGQPYVVCGKGTSSGVYELVIQAISGGTNYKSSTLPTVTTTKNFTWTVFKTLTRNGYQYWPVFDSAPDGFTFYAKDTSGKFTQLTGWNTMATLKQKYDAVTNKSELCYINSTSTSLVCVSAINETFNDAYGEDAAYTIDFNYAWQYKGSFQDYDSSCLCVPAEDENWVTYNDESKYSIADRGAYGPGSDFDFGTWNASEPKINNVGVNTIQSAYSIASTGSFWSAVSRAKGPTTTAYRWDCSENDWKMGTYRTASHAVVFTRYFY